MAGVGDLPPSMSQSVSGPILSQMSFNPLLIGHHMHFALYLRLCRPENERGLKGASITFSLHYWTTFTSFYSCESNILYEITIK